MEENYISKDFLDGYSTYYSYCFENYPKVCRRIHFFRNEFDAKELTKQLLKDDDPEFWEGYLGFIVVKPIPITVIGLTLLKTYSDPEDSRSFWGTRQYLIHLFGKQLKIESLAFQEQDSVIAACATTAIWSMLNKASLNFHTSLKSPSQITRDADNISPDGSRLFPNKGLSILQICQAIVNSGLVSEIKRPNIRHSKEMGQVVSGVYIRKILNAYSSLGIPIILVIKVPFGENYGAHAIAVSGFKFIKPQITAPKDEITWHSDNIEKIYAHDDQWGPFARLTFLNDGELENHWTKNDPKKRPTLVQYIIVPVFPKVRISYEDIEAIVLGLDLILRLFFTNKIVADLVWDIKILYSQDHKNGMRQYPLSEPAKINRLTLSLPKYVWVANCSVAGQKMMEFVFDATGVQNAMLGIDIICFFSRKIRLDLQSFLRTNKQMLEPLIKHKGRGNYYKFFIESL
ncbi:hypothetical protein [Flagellimonas amoyensis]|uniref:hypothetical protein n=1 Tax=Flagellimonas amoyensis TaxID=2169401 RepID=UPI00131EF40C|nr:hypothetical protein [Allomuricauda amoyensis]